MNSLAQTIAITLANLRSIPARFGSSLVICTGIGGVVAVLVTVLAMANGLTKTVASAGDPDRAIVMRNGALAESLSTLSRDALLAIESAPGIAAISPEVVLSVTLQRKAPDEMAAIVVRGITDEASVVRPEVKLIEGRLPTPGLREIAAGRAAVREFANLAPGSTVEFHGGPWHVVGIFTSRGDAHESELFADANTLMAAANRIVFNAATVRLESPAAIGALEAALTSDPRLAVEVQRESEYYAELAEGVAGILELVARVVAGIMAIGALLGALNTMYTAVAARTAEIGTMRAIGFGALPVVTSVVAEALLLAVIGGAMGAAVAWFAFNGNHFATGSSIARTALTLRIDPALALTGIAWATTIGIMGGMPPAIRAARLPIAESLRAN